jgi:uncharacterized protein YbbC (DUF1343 family)
MNSAGLEGVSFSAQSFTPTKSLYSGQRCRGLLISVSDRQLLKPTAVFLALNTALRRLHPKEFVWTWEEARKMTGSREFRRIYESDGSPEKLKALFEDGAREFSRKRQPYLLYR